MHSTSVLHASHWNRLPNWFGMVSLPSIRTLLRVTLLTEGSAYFCCISLPQHWSVPSPAFVTIISVLHCVH